MSPDETSLETVPMMVHVPAEKSEIVESIESGPAEVDQMDVCAVPAVDQEATQLITPAAEPLLTQEYPQSTVFLTKDFIKDVWSGKYSVNANYNTSNPVVQILAAKQYNERFRAALSDGSHSTQAIFNAGLNKLFEENELPRHCIIELVKFTVSTVNSNSTVLVLVQELKVLRKDSEKIGSPTVYTSEENQKQLNVAPVHNEPQATQQEPKSSPLTKSPSGVPDICPISALNPYQNRFSIRARVTNKGEIRRWTNQRGDGKLFSFDLVDDSGEIRATAFNEQVDRFYDLLQKDKVYIISRPSLKVGKRMYTAIKNDYEITVDQNTNITLCEEDTSSVPKTFYSFVQIDQIEAIPKEAMIDILAIVKEVGELSSINTKQQKKLNKRDLKVFDRSLKEVSITCWGELADTLVAQASAVVAIKGCRVSDYNGRSLSTISSSSITVNPKDIPEALELEKWYSSVGVNSSTVSISVRTSPNGRDSEDDRYTFKKVELEQITAEKPLYFTICATIMTIPHEKAVYYPAEPETGNKLVQTSDGWINEKTKKTFAKCDYRYLLRFSAMDYTGSQYINAFGAEAQSIMGISASDLVPLQETSKNEYEACFDKATFRPFVFRMRAKLEEYQGDSKVKLSAVSCKPVDFVSESKVLLKLISKYGL